MNPIPADLMARGLNYERYRHDLVDQNQQHLDAVYAEPMIEPADLALLHRMPPQVVVAVAEDWCPDVYWTLPTWARVVEQLPEWELKVFRARDHKPLADTFVVKEYARRVPVFAFYDRQGRLQTWWSGRGAAAQAAIDEALGGVPYKDADDAAHRRAAAVFHERYPVDFRRRNFEEILRLLMAFHHLA